MVAANARHVVNHGILTAIAAGHTSNDLDQCNVLTNPTTTNVLVALVWLILSSGASYAVFRITVYWCREFWKSIKERQFRKAEWWLGFSLISLWWAGVIGMTFTIVYIPLRICLLTL